MGISVNGRGRYSGRGGGRSKNGRGVIHSKVILEPRKIFNKTSNF